MSSALNITRPIIGLATNQFIPFTDINFVFACLFLSIESATLLLWAVILVAIVRDRHYEDPNNLLIVSFALADIVCTSTILHSAVSNVWDYGYSRGFTGTTIDYPEAYHIIEWRIINTYLLHRLFMGDIRPNYGVLCFRIVSRCNRYGQISPHASWILCKLVKDWNTAVILLV